MNFCGLGTSNSKTSSFHVGESSNAPLLLMRTNELQNGYETSSIGLRHVSDNQIQLSHDQEKEQTTTDANTTDNKQLIRRMANRRSAQRSRERKQKYTTDLEEKENLLKGNLMVLRTEIEVMAQRNKQLLLDKKMLEDKVYNLTLKHKIRQVRIETARFEIEKMKEHHNHGMMRMMRNVGEPDLTLSLALPGMRARW